MVNQESLNSDTAYYESEQRYMEKYYPLIAGFKDYNIEHKSAHTLDEYLMFLVKGYINVHIRSNLDKHLMELLEDDWFYQWPLIHWTYASRLLYGTGCRKSVKRAVDILLPMAREGCPGALYDIGYCYMKGLCVEQSYAKGIHYWVLSSRKGYIVAQDELRIEYFYGQYGNFKELPIKVQYDFICEVKNVFLKFKGATEMNASRKLDKEDYEKYEKLYKKEKRLKTEVVKKERLQEIGSFFWSEDENPYKIDV